MSVCASGGCQAVLGWSPYSKEDLRRKLSGSPTTSTENKLGGVLPTAFCGFLGYQADPSLTNEAGTVSQTLQDDH